MFYGTNPKPTITLDKFVDKGTVSSWPPELEEANYQDVYLNRFFLVRGICNNKQRATIYQRTNTGYEILAELGPNLVYENWDFNLNKDGFERSKHTEVNEDNFPSDRIYFNAETGTAEIILPEIGNVVADIWDLVYTTDDETGIRETELSFSNKENRSADITINPTLGSIITYLQNLIGRQICYNIYNYSTLTDFKNAVKTFSLDYPFYIYIDGNNIYYKVYIVNSTVISEEIENFDSTKTILGLMVEMCDFLKKCRYNLSGEKFKINEVNYDYVCGKNTTTFGNSLLNTPYEERNITYNSTEYLNTIGNISRGDNSFSIGNNNYSVGENSFTQGDGNIAVGNNSFASGCYTVARGIGSHAEGMGAAYEKEYLNVPIRDLWLDILNLYCNETYLKSKYDSDGILKEEDNICEWLPEKEEDFTPISDYYYFKETLINETVIPDINYGADSLEHGYGYYEKEGIAVSVPAFGATLFEELFDNYETYALSYFSFLKEKFYEKFLLIVSGTGTILDFGALGNYSHAEGLSTQAFGRSSHAEGESTFARADNSHAEGDTTDARGASSHAEGHNTLAEGMYSHAEGQDTYAKGIYSHAGGKGTEARGDGSCSLGRVTRADGQDSLSNGYNTFAAGRESFCGGNENVTIGRVSFSFGRSHNQYLFKDTDYTEIKPGIWNSFKFDYRNSNIMEELIWLPLLYSNYNTEVEDLHIVPDENFYPYVSSSDASPGACPYSAYQAAVGIASITMGVDNVALGSSSVAIGQYNLALYNNTMLFGKGLVSPPINVSLDLERCRVIVGQFNYVKEEEGQFKISADDSDAIFTVGTGTYNATGELRRMSGLQVGQSSPTIATWGLTTNNGTEGHIRVALTTYENNNSYTKNYRIFCLSPGSRDTENTKDEENPNPGNNPHAYYLGNSNTNRQWDVAYINTINYKTLNQSSDARLKNIINDEIAKEKLLDVYNDLKPTLFRYKNNPSDIRVGFIAQEVEQAINENGLASENYGIVHIEELEEPTEYCPDKKEYSLNYSEFHALHVAKNQEQDKRIEELENKIKKLEELLEGVINEK